MKIFKKLPGSIDFSPRSLIILSGWTPINGPRESPREAPSRCSNLITWEYKPLYNGYTHRNTKSLNEYKPVNFAIFGPNF